MDISSWIHVLHLQHFRKQVRDTRWSNLVVRNQGPQLLHQLWADRLANESVVFGVHQLGAVIAAKSSYANPAAEFQVLATFGVTIITYLWRTSVESEQRVGTHTAVNAMDAQVEEPNSNKTSFESQKQINKKNETLKRPISRDEYTLGRNINSNNTLVIEKWAINNSKT